MSRPARTAERAPVARRRHEDAVHAAVGVVGELLITLGVVIGLFVVWQLWWTDVAAGRTQDRLIAQLDWPEPAPPATTGSPGPHLRTDEPPVLDEGELDGGVLALLSVPRWGGADPVTIMQGVDKATVLDTGSGGHYPETAMPGGWGNFAIAGHRTTYGKPFHRIAELGEGDALVVRTREVWYVYRVTAHRIVEPDQVEVVAPVPDDPTAVPTARTITLTACHPMYSARQRYVVHGLLEGWLPVADGAPAALTGGA